jgi:hypothetical protein
VRLKAPAALGGRRYNGGVGYVLLALAVLAVVWGWYEAGAGRRLLLAAALFAVLVLMHTRGVVLLRLGQPWLSLAAAGVACACFLSWCSIVRPHQVRERRREQGLCVGCGYDPSGNAGDVCPECRLAAPPAGRF